MDERPAKQPIPETMLQAIRQFGDPQVAHDFFVQIRFPNGVACPRMGCGSARVAYLAKVRRWYCNECKRQFSAKVGTIFEDSPIGLDKWLPAIWLIASNRNGISSYEIARGLGVTQKTAWFMLHRIREAMQSDSFRLFTGTVEADETFIGGKFDNKPLKVRRKLSKRNWVMEGKTAVFGMVERPIHGHKGEVRAMTVPSTQKATLTPILRRYVHHDATMHTDEARQYQSLLETFLYHQTVNHSAMEYVRGAVHTNTIENFWAVLKRTLAGTYISVRPFHLDRYLHEQVCRFNAREEQDGPRFANVVKRADGRRLTWKALTDKAQS
jgi:transposase-like protein